MEGWIKLHRKIQSNWVWQDPEYFKFWIYLLMDVNHEPKMVCWNKKLIKVERGEKITSLSKLAIEFNCSRSKVRHFLSILQREHMIEHRSCTNYTHLKVCNYDNYQIQAHTKSTPKKRPKHDDQHKQEGKEGKEEKYNKKIPSLEEFEKYALDKKPNVSRTALRFKYAAWVENDWKDGNDRPIKNWKSKLLNTLPHMKEDLQAGEDTAEFNKKLRSAQK